MSDPNGLIEWHGRYHLFYQTNPHQPVHGSMYWGHASSADLVHWQHLPLALAPTPGEPDQDGCCSGCIVDDGGIPRLVYTGVSNNKQTVCLAEGDAHLIHWQKYRDNPVIAASPPGLSLSGFRDPWVWRAGGLWQMIIGAGNIIHGGMLLRYQSPDLLNWTYCGPFFTAQQARGFGVPEGEMWECPSLFDLDGRLVILISIIEGGAAAAVVAWSGHEQNGNFVPDRAQLLDCGGSRFYAPHSLRDHLGRRLVWGRVAEERPGSGQETVGWAGVMSLPRQLSMDGTGRLSQRFPAELAALRRRELSLEGIDIFPNCDIHLVDQLTDLLEIELDLEFSQASRAGIKVLRSARGDEETCLYVDWRTQQVVIDRQRSQAGSSLPAITGKFNLPGDGRIRLHLFIDRSVIEVIVNDETALTGRVYPSQHKRRGIALFAQFGQVHLRSFQSWDLQPISNQDVQAVGSAAE